MNISIIGASGFVGKNLIAYLLEHTEHTIRAIAPHPEGITFEEKYQDRVKVIKADVFEYEEIRQALAGTEVAYYFVHMLDKKGDFCQQESDAAEMAGRVLQAVSIKRVIYLGGLGNDMEKLSKHLYSRHLTGEILRKYVTPVIEFRASMIIGVGSVPYEIVRDIVHRAPMILIPGKSATRTQPITIADALEYLVLGITLPTAESLIIEIGGAEVMTYEDFIKKYKKFAGRGIPVIRVPFLPSPIAGWFLNFFTTRRRARIGQNMLKSFQNEMIVTNTVAHQYFPDIHTHPIEDIFLSESRK